MATERDRERVAFLLTLYELTDADTMARVDFREVGKRLGLADQQAEKVTRYLADHGLAEWRALGGRIGLTSAGVDEAERLQGDGATIPLGVTVLSVEEQRAVEVFLTAYRKSADTGELNLPSEQLAEADADVATLEAQMRSPRPKRRVIRAVADELHALLLNVAGSGAYAALVRLSQEIV